MMASMHDIFADGGILSTHLKGYSCRPGQLQMAESVENMLEADREEGKEASCLVVEAETGLGKTLAYLIPAILSGRKVVVSTNTRNLQDQILHREIPFIIRYLAPGLKALCVKGKQNYLCLYRWHQLVSAAQEELFSESRQQKINEWIENTRYGDRTELDWLPGNAPLWQKICCQSHFCLGNACPDGSACFLSRLRRDAADSDLLVVNHHLLFSDLVVRKTGFGEVLPRYETVLFDEAHHLEQVATQFFGFTFSKFQTLDLAGDIERSAQIDLAGEVLTDIQAAVNELVGAIEQFTFFFPPEKGRFAIAWDSPIFSKTLEQGNHLVAVFSRLSERIKAVKEKQDGPWEQYGQRAEELCGRLKQIMAISSCEEEGEMPSYISWYERGERNITLSASPVEVAADLHKTLYAHVAHCLFTSATLTASGTFHYLYASLGLPAETPSLRLPSPFDYKRRTLLYIPPRRFPAPTESGYQQAVYARMEELIGLAHGRALLLFTSFQAMEGALSYLERRLDFPLFMQGQAPRHTLLRQFCQQIDSVLLAVASFWEGVDVPGEALSLVVMDKLPFEVPSDPVIMARIKRIQEMGGNPFFEFQIPRAIFTLRQGAGRLMRSATDRGVIAVLDARLTGKSYGRQFLKSLPPSPVVDDLDKVALFFSGEKDDAR